MLENINHFNGDTVCIGERYKQLLEKSIKDYGLRCLTIPANPELSSQLSFHVDLSVLLVENTAFVADYLKNSELYSLLTSKGFDIVNIHGLEKEYPYDCKLNVSIIGDRYICNPKAVSPVVNKCLIELGYKPIYVKQGYAKCTVCKVSENAIITADKSIACESDKHGIDVLLINPGNIILDGFEYGFIGGATFLINKALHFTGSIDAFPENERKKMLDFITAHNVEIRFLSDKPVFDIGSAIII